MTRSTQKTADSIVDVLIVEDSPTQSLQLRHLLEQNGYRVTSAGNGKQALAKLAEYRPNIVISDIIMPEMDGYALCNAIKSDVALRDIPVILVTSLTDLQGIVKGLECGADNFIRKPYDEKYLLARINYLLMNRAFRSSERVQMGMEIHLLGKRHIITVERQQIIDLLISVYEEAMRMNEELEIRQQELANSNQTLCGLYRIADGLNHAVNAQEVIEKALERAVELPGITACWITLVNRDQSFHLAGSRNLPPEISDKIASSSDCSCRQKLLSNELHTAINITECTFLHNSKQSGVSPPCCCHTSIPISASNHPLGILNLLHCEDRLLKDEELQTLQGIGNQIAMALMRAQIHEQLEDLVNQRTASLRAEIAVHTRTQNALATSQARFAGILEIAQEAIISVNEQQCITLFNHGAEKIFGYYATEVMGRPFDILLPEQYRQRHRQHIADFASSGECTRLMGERMELVGMDKHGKIFPVEASISKLELGEEKILTTVLRDISQFKLHEAKILRLNRIYAVLSGINTAIVHIRDRQQLIAESCEIAAKAGGFSLAWLGLIDDKTGNVLPMAHSGAGTAYLDELARFSADTTGITHDLLVTACHERRAIISNTDENTNGLTENCKQLMLKHNLQAVAAFPLIVMDTVIGGFALYASERDFFDEQELRLLDKMVGDISYALENIEKDRQLNYLACYDKITDLPNRTLLNDSLGQLLPKIKQNNQRKLAILLLDIDRFKLINDSLGYLAGDTLLNKIAGRLVERVPAEDSISRGVADEFVIVMPDIDDLGDIAKFINETIIPALSLAFVINGEELRITFRTGISVYPDDADSIETLHLHSEVALDKAKKSISPYLFYSPEMNASVNRVLAIENKLRMAIERNEFLLYYQPKVALATGAICGMEALLRWQDPENGFVMPADFIPILEETGMIIDVGKWVVDTVCRQHGIWRDKGLSAPPIAVNVSSLQLAQDNFVTEMSNPIHDHAIQGNLLEFEMTESIIMRDVLTSINKLKALQSLGSHISVDDFGTGYSSLSYLTRLPLSRLKIDKSFISEMMVSTNSLTIVSSVIALAHGLNLKVIAEGVETQEQLNLLKSLKCDEIQGYFAYRPMPLNEIEHLLLNLNRSKPL